MDLTPLALSDCWLATPHNRLPQPDRGRLISPETVLAQAIGRCTGPATTDHETVSRGVVRGIRWEATPPGEATYLACRAGAVLAVVVDLRVGSLTFGDYAAAELDDVRSRAVCLGPGLGHGFVALTDVATVMSWRASLAGPEADPSAGRAATARRTVHPLDPSLALPWSNGGRPELSAEDDAAPWLVDALTAGLLPSAQDCRGRRPAPVPA